VIVSDATLINVFVLKKREYMHTKGNGS